MSTRSLLIASSVRSGCAEGRVGRTCLSKVIKEAGTMICGHVRLVGYVERGLEITCFSWSELVIILCRDHRTGGSDANRRQRGRCCNRSDETSPGHSTHGATQKACWFHLTLSSFVSSRNPRTQRVASPCSRRRGPRTLNRWAITGPKRGIRWRFPRPVTRWIPRARESGREPVAMRIWSSPPDVTGKRDVFAICQIPSPRKIT